MSQMPDKIWLHKDTKYSTSGKVLGYQYKCLAEIEGTENFVEYTRTDAFIDKAVEFLSKESNIPLWADRSGNFGCNTSKLVEKFVNYMKG